MSAVSSAYVVENGIHHGKYSEGERWVINTDKYYSFPGALYVVGVYGDGNCLTRPIYVNLPLYDYVIGEELSFDATLVDIDDSLTIVMRGNTVMETQYYVEYRNTDDYLPEASLFQDENYVALGKNGQYVMVPVTEKEASYAFVGCMAESSRSRIIILSLSSPLPATRHLNHPETQYSIHASEHPRKQPQPVDPKTNTGGLDIDDAHARHSNPSNCPIRIRNVQTINDVVYIRCLIMGGPFDVYYMIRPENSVRGDPGDREVMRFGEKAGQFADESFDIVVTDYVSSVRNVAYVVAVKGKAILGPEIGRASCRERV